MGQVLSPGAVGSVWHLPFDTLAPQGRGLEGEWANVTGRRPLSLSSVPSRVSPALSCGDTGQEAGHPVFSPSLPPFLQGHSSRRGGPVVPAFASGRLGSLCPLTAGRWATSPFRVASLFHRLCS